jgi:hypothetical protein
VGMHGFLYVCGNARICLPVHGNSRLSLWECKSFYVSVGMLRYFTLVRLYLWECMAFYMSVGTLS